jgi:hypothetical protein
MLVCSLHILTHSQPLVKPYRSRLTCVSTRSKGEHRTIEHLREDYEVERELADRLRNASRQDRRHLYSFVYDELSGRMPRHPQLTRKSSPESSAKQAMYAESEGKISS